MSLVLALSAGCSSDPAPPPADAAVTVDGGAASDAPDGGALPVDVNLGPARAVFDLDADTALPAHFYDLPFPSDLRRTAAGGPDYGGFPVPATVGLVRSALEGFSAGA